MKGTRFWSCVFLCLPICYASVGAPQRPVRTMSKAETLRLYESLHGRSVGALASVFATKSAKSLPPAERALVERCLKLATSIAAYSRCLKPAFTLQDYYERHRRRRRPASNGWQRQHARAKRQVTRLVEARDPDWRAGQGAQPQASRGVPPHKTPQRSGPGTLSSVAARMLSLGIGKLKEAIVRDSNDTLSPAMRKVLDTKKSSNWESVYREVKVYAERKEWDKAHRKLYDDVLKPGQEKGNDTQDALLSDTISAVQSLYSLVTGRPGRLAAKATSPRIASPDFLSITPKDGGGVLSPNLFSFFRSKDAVASIPELLSGLGEAERREWLGVVMEASGATAAMEGLLEDIRRAEGNGTSSEGPYHFASPAELRKTFGADADGSFAFLRDLVGNISVSQLEELVETGLAYMSPAQVDFVYGPGGRYRDAVDPDFDLESYKRLRTKREKELLARAALKDLAYTAGFRLEERFVFGDNVSWAFSPGQVLLNSSYSRRLKSPKILKPSSGAVVLEPAVLGPFILSPLVLHPLILSPEAVTALILSPEVLGPDILSPIAINGVVLSPSVLGPFVLSPNVLVPIILSPEVLDPYILSPFALSPFVLSPGVLDPFVLNPVVLSPVILSPHVLSPIIFSPHVLSPEIESEFVLSPVIGSPHALS